MNLLAALLRLAVVCAMLLTNFARAEMVATAQWPTKPVKLMVPFSAGGPTDVIARLLAERLRTIWKQPVVLEYRAGGGTAIGTQYVAASPPDGYTLGVAVNAYFLQPVLIKDLPYDIKKDLTGVSYIARSHLGLYAPPSAPFNNMQEMIAYAKMNPGKLSYGMHGIGSTTHVAGELLNYMAGLNLVAIPYKGSVGAQQDVLGGRLPLFFDPTFSSEPFVKDGRMKVIALLSPTRVAGSPKVPVIAETLPGYEALSITGIIAPAGVPPALLKRISKDIAEAVKSPEVSQRMEQLGMEPIGSTPDEYNAVIDTEIKKWTAVVKKAGITIEK